MNYGLHYKCGGPGSNKPGPCPEAIDADSGETSPVASKAAHQAALRLTQGIAHLPSAVWTKAKGTVKAKYAKLESRYGRKMALSIMAAGIVGTATPLPAGGLIAAAPLIGAGELYLRLSRKKTAPAAAEPAKAASAPILTQKHIEKLPDGQYRLYSRGKGPDGKRKNLGTFPSRAAARKREREVEYFKRKSASGTDLTRKGEGPSFFQDCPRDSSGHCKPKGSGDEDAAGGNYDAGEQDGKPAGSVDPHESRKPGRESLQAFTALNTENYKAQQALWMDRSLGVLERKSQVETLMRKGDELRNAFYGSLQSEPIAISTLTSSIAEVKQIDESHYLCKDRQGNVEGITVDPDTVRKMAGGGPVPGLDSPEALKKEEAGRQQFTQEIRASLPSDDAGIKAMLREREHGTASDIFHGLALPEERLPTRTGLRDTEQPVIKRINDHYAAVFMPPLGARGSYGDSDGKYGILPLAKLQAAHERWKRWSKRRERHSGASEKSWHPETEKSDGQPFFASCERDEHGHCKPGTGGGSSGSSADKPAAPEEKTEQTPMARRQAKRAEHEQAQAAWDARQTERDQKREAIESFAQDTRWGTATAATLRKVDPFASLKELSAAGPAAYRQRAGEWAEQHVKLFAETFGATLDRMAALGLPEKTREKAAALVEKGKAALDKAAGKYLKSVDKLQALEAQEATLGYEPEEPDEPGEPDISRDDSAGKEEWAEYDRDRAQWEQDHAAWEKASEKWNERSSDLEEKISAASEAEDEAHGRLEGISDDLADKIESVIDFGAGQAIQTIDTEEIRDEAPEEPDWSEMEPEVQEANGKIETALDSVREQDLSEPEEEALTRLEDAFGQIGVDPDRDHATLDGYVKATRDAIPTFANAGNTTAVRLIRHSAARALRALKAIHPEG